MWHSSVRPVGRSQLAAGRSTSVSLNVQFGLNVQCEGGIMITVETVYTGHLGTGQKCPDCRGGLIFQGQSAMLADEFKSYIHSFYRSHAAYADHML